MAKKKNSPGYIWSKRNLSDHPDSRIAWAFQEKLEQNQWAEPVQLEHVQLLAAQALASHAKRQVPHFTERLAQVDFSTTPSWDWFRTLPITTRSELQQSPDRFVAVSYPAEHGTMTETSSSGSTAQPISIRHTALSRNWHKALSFRALLWSMKRFDRRLAALRRYPTGDAVFPDGFHNDRWAQYNTIPTLTGDVFGLTVATPLNQQVEWLEAINPETLVTFPSNLEALCIHYPSLGKKLPNLKSINTLGEALPDALRQIVRKTFGIQFQDTYSAAEVGEIAIQCPDTENYHIQSESLIVEVLNEQNLTCAPAETGRVVITSLHNFAQPFIRYEIGDYAVVGAQCKCGRGLPTLKRILGRHRNMMQTPSGKLFWPSFGLKSSSRSTPIRQAQFIQHAPDKLEAVLVSPRFLTQEEEALVRSNILDRLPEPVDVQITYKDALERGASGKFEEFVCEIQP